MTVETGTSVSMTIEQIGLLLSLLLTIAGWGITAYYQRRILERQIAADKEKEARQLIIPRRMQELDTIRQWLEQGHTLWVLREKLPYDEDLSKKELQTRTREIDEQLMEWSARYDAIASLASVLDPADPDLGEGDEREDLNWLMSAIVHNMPTVNWAYDRDPKQSEHAIWVIARFFPRAIQRIHWLVERAVDEASREVAKYQRKRG